MNHLDEDLREVIERARVATEENQRRHGSRVPTHDRFQRAADMLQDRIPAFLLASELESRIKDPRLLHVAHRWDWGWGSVLMLGPTGCGKTTAAGAVVRRLVKEAARIGAWEWQSACSIWWYATTTLELARRQHPIGHGEAPEVSRACTAKLLVLDDLGWERDPLIVAYVLNDRMERGLPTIVTSGRTEPELKQMYGGAVVRRLVDAGGVKALVVDCFQPPKTAPTDFKTAAAGG